MLPKCCAEHQKPDAFQRFSPTFQKLFLKRDFFDSLNGLRFPSRSTPEGVLPEWGWRVGRDNATLTEPASSHAKCLTARRACARRPYGRQSHHASPGVLCRGSGALHSLAPPAITLAPHCVRCSAGERSEWEGYPGAFSGRFVGQCRRALTACQQSNTDQQISFRNR